MRLSVLIAAALFAQPATAQTVEFGSYGRVGFSSDLSGASGQPSQLVFFGPRLIESTYLELDFGAKLPQTKSADVRVVTTLAFDDRLFHYTGDWDAGLAIRQVFVEATDLFNTGAFVWLGSKYFRGDTIYLLDFWPMDDLNTLGLAGGWRSGDTTLTAHIGVNRLENKGQIQRILVPANDFGTQTITVLDRQRAIAALMAERRFGGVDGALAYKLRLYGEAHMLPQGEQVLDGSFTKTKPLSDDRGFVIGAQFGLWNFMRRGHLNVWLRYASGLAAFDELGQPYGLNTERRSVDADEVRLAVDGNLETGDFGVAYAGMLRLFYDADNIEADFDDRQEGAIVVRPHYRFGLFNPAIEASLQVSRPNGLNPRTNEQSVAQVAQIGFIPAITLTDDVGTYSRPQLRLIYAISFLNQAALDRYPIDDPRSSHATVHYLGVGAEWWFGRGGGY